MSTCKTATALHLYENRKLKIQQNVPNDFPQVIDHEFVEILSVR